MNERKKKVIVCGVGFGQFYLKAIELLPHKYELVGILSKGSEKSKEYAKNYKVPLFTDITQIWEIKVDLVCVVVKSTVVGGVGSNIVQEILSHGVDVIQEHPVHLDELTYNIKLARQHKCRYLLNTFYPNLKRVSDFIKNIKILKDNCIIQYIHADCSVHVLFPLIDIIGRGLGGLRPWNFKLLEKATDKIPFSIISGEINSIPININIQNQIEPVNPENNTLLLHVIEIFTNSGKLTLTGPNGIIVWEPCMNKTLDANGDFRIDKEDVFLDLTTYETWWAKQEISFREMFTEEWPESIKKSLENFYDAYENSTLLNQEMQYVLGGTKAWQVIGKELGNAQIIPAYKKRAINLKELFYKASE